MKLNNTGVIVLKDRVKEIVKKDVEFLLEIQGFIHRFQHSDLGEIKESCKGENYKALENNDIIIGKYISSEGKIWIVSDNKGDKIAVMFPDDYDGADSEYL